MTNEKIYSELFKINMPCRIFAIIIFKIFILIPSTLAQVDTSKLKLIVSQIQSTEDHIDFWQSLDKRDQTFRGWKTSKINDLENLISAIYYLNKFGYPSEEIKLADIMPYIWIHAPYPKVEQVSFPIILAGYKSGQISEKDIRLYYLRNKHWRKFHNEENRTKDLYVMFADLNMSVKDKIDITDVLEAYNESEKFLNQNFVIIGHWYNSKGGSPVKILKSEDGEYYYHKLYLDGSFYPQKVIQDEHNPNLFRNYYNPELYFGIQPNGDLTVENCFDNRTYKPIGKED